MFETASFIKADARSLSIVKEESNAPLFRKRFWVDRIEQATIAVCGLGIGYYYINGQKVSEDLFTAPVSDYNKTLWYTTYDVTHLLRQGENVLAVALGNGMYNEREKNSWGTENAPWRDAPKVIVDLTVNGERVLTTDSSWRCMAKSATVYNELRVGEVFDAREYNPRWAEISFDDSNWATAVLDDNPPKGVFRECTCQPIRENQIYPATYLGKTPDNKLLFDIGKNISGYVRISVSGEAGREIIIRHGECLQEDGTLFLTDNGYYFGAPYHICRLICNGQPITWQPKFSYYGFRYIEVDGVDDPESIEVSGIFVHQAIERLSAFSCSDERVNRLFDCGVRSSYSNMFYMMTDCPSREKLGWGNDVHMSAQQLLTNFKIEDLFSKWMIDVYDAMDETGDLPGIMPTSGWGFDWGNGPVANGILFEIPYQVYLHTGKKELLVESLPWFARYFGWVNARTDEDGFVAHGLGDWTNPVSNYAVPLELIDGLLLSRFYEIAALAAELSGKDGDAYIQKADGFKRRVQKRYLDQNGRCIVEEQTAVALLLARDAYETAEPLKQQLKELIEENGFHHSCGIVGHRWLYPALNKVGLEEYAWKILNAKGFPGYDTWLAEDATTLFESWDKDSMDASRNHHMYSSFMEWLTQTILGIRGMAPGFQAVEIRPRFFGELTYANGYCDTVCGRIAVKWERENNEIVLTITVPQGMEAMYDGRVLPAGESQYRIPQTESE